MAPNSPHPQPLSRCAAGRGRYPGIGRVATEKPSPPTLLPVRGRGEPQGRPRAESGAATPMLTQPSGARGPSPAQRLTGVGRHVMAQSAAEKPSPPAPLPVRGRGENAAASPVWRRGGALRESVALKYLPQSAAHRGRGWGEGNPLECNQSGTQDRSRTVLRTKRARHELTSGAVVGRLRNASRRRIGGMWDSSTNDQRRGAERRPAARAWRQP